MDVPSIRPRPPVGRHDASARGPRFAAQTTGNAVLYSTSHYTPAQWAAAAEARLHLGFLVEHFHRATKGRLA